MRKKSKLIILAFLSCFLIVFKWAGFFQSLELSLYDHWWKKAPIEAIEPRIVIIGLDETDLTEHFGQFPPSNTQLADLIEQVEVQKPAVIGLDIIRDLKVEGRLAEIFRSSNIYGVGDPFGGFNFPSILKQRRQVGTARVEDEPDGGSGYVRRIELFARTDRSVEAKTAHLGLELVVAYLKKKNQYKAFKENGILWINNKKLPRFQPTDGGYSLKSISGYITFQRWRKGHYRLEEWEDRFPIITARQLAQGQVDPQLLTDKIVLIGYRATSVKDKFITPLGYRYGVDIVAQVASQYLSYLEDNRPLLGVIPEWLEYILMILVIGSAYFQSRFLTYRNLDREFLFHGVIGIAIALGLYGVGFQLLMGGLWIPMGQLIISYLSTAIILLFGSYLTYFQRLSRNLEQQVAQRTQELKEKAQELEASHQQLKETQSRLILEEKQLTVGRFALRMAHSIQTYLKTSSLAHGMLEEDCQNFEEWSQKPNSQADFRENLEILGDSLRNLREMFDNLRVISLDRTVEAEELNLNEILLEVIRSYQPLCNEQQIQLSLHLEALPTLFYYRLAFKEMISVLLMNAVEALNGITERPKQIVLSATFENEIVKIMVNDNGCGIPLEWQPRITEPLITTKEKGMGLGLFFVYQNLLQLQGTIKIKSQENVSTSVSLLIPINDS